jgi:hypothetical protein
MRDSLTFIECSGRESSAAPARLLGYAEDVRRRLRPVCSDWREDEFELVVTQIALTKVRWEDSGRAD